MDTLPYIEDTWRFLPHYTCTLCRYDTLQWRNLVAHFQSQHQQDLGAPVMTGESPPEGEEA